MSHYNQYENQELTGNLPDEQQEDYGQQAYERNENGSQAQSSSAGMPQNEEIEDYARFLGMDLNDTVDRQLLWIAQRGLLAPVPEPWQETKDIDDNIIYYNVETKERTHEHPCDVEHRELYQAERQKFLINEGIMQPYDSSAGSPMQEEKSPQSIGRKIKKAIESSNVNTSKKSKYTYEGNEVGTSGTGSWNTEAKRGKGEFNPDPLIEELQKKEQTESKQSNSKRLANGYPISIQYSNSPGSDEKFFPVTENTKNVGINQNGEEYDLDAQNNYFSQQNANNMLPESIGESIVNERQTGSKSITAKPKEANLSTGGVFPGGPLSTSGHSNRHPVGMSMYSSQQQPQIMFPNHRAGQNQIISGPMSSNYEQLSQNSLFPHQQVMQNFNYGGFQNNQVLQEQLMKNAAAAQVAQEAEVQLEYEQKLDKYKRERDTEIQILGRRLKRSKREQVSDLNATQQFEVQTQSKGLKGDIDGDFMLKRNEYQSESDARMQKELQMARSEAEFKGERVRRRYEEKLSEERDRQDTFHQLELEQLKRESASKIKLARSRAEVDDDALFESKAEVANLQEQVQQLSEDREAALEKKRDTLKRECRQDADQMRKSLQAEHDAKLFRLKSKHKQNLEEQQFKLAKRQGEQQIRDETTKAEMRHRMLTQIDVDQKRADVETQDRLRAARQHHEELLMNKRKEIAQRLELDLQRRVNGEQATHHDAMRKATLQHKEKYELVKNAELREIQGKQDQVFMNKMNEIQERAQTQEFAWSAQETVLKELEQLRHRVKALSIAKIRLRDEKDSTKLEREMLSQKLHVNKQKNTEYIAEMEKSLQIELQEAKNELDDKQERITKMKTQKRSNDTSDQTRVHQNRLRQDTLQKDIDSIKQKVNSMLQDGKSFDSQAFQITDLKQVIPSELAKVEAKIQTYESDLQKLKSMSYDMNEGLFEGLQEHESAAMFTKLNAFKQDINQERQTVELEVLRVNSTLTKLRDSQSMLERMQRQLTSGQNIAQEGQNELSEEFKTYLMRRHEAHLDAQEPNQHESYQPHRESKKLYGGVVNLKYYGGYTNRQFYQKESEWMRTNLRDLTLI